jgi:hypothetical protein
MSIQPAQPQSIGGVLDTTFQLFKASVVRLIPLSLLMVVAGSPSSIYILTQGASSNPADPFGMLGMMSRPGYWLSALAGMLGTVWMMSAAYLKIGAIGAGGDLGLGPALQKAVTRLPSVALMMILFGFAVGIGMVLLIVPGLILMVSLALCFNPALFEDKGPFESLSESHRLVWGNWWRTAAILTVGFIVLIVIYMLAGLIIGVVMPLAVLGGAAGENFLMTSMISGMLIGTLVSLLVTPFYISLAIATYWDLKLRKDGADLAARVGALNPA